MAVPAGEEGDVYATLLLSDTYLPGALVLAHSLRDAGTNRKLAVLVTLDTVSADVVTQLKSLFDYVIPVPRIRNEYPDNLYLMNRADLHSAFTKINLWKQTQFRKIVYIDADVVAYRAPDELFDLPHAFSAAPDIGWPDLFNTGVMALTPNLGDYYAMMAMAERGISFDGADQGLLNMHFQNNYNRLSFTYNVTPSAHYQYIPAYRHFQSSINMVHFIGPNKPWFQGRDAGAANSPFDQMIGRWWAVYDRHYRVPSPSLGPSAFSGTSKQVPPEQKKPPFQPSMSDWDAQRHAPPKDSRPEALNFPATIYQMSRDSAPFVAPQRYPSPPKNMYYEVPKETPAAPYDAPKAIFPWETNRPAPSRVFADEAPRKEPEGGTQSPPTPTRTSTTEQKSEPATPTTPSIRVTPSDPWSTFTRTNAWDDNPEIERYVDAVQKKHGRSRSLKSPGVIAMPSPGGVDDIAWRGQGAKLTDFPSAVERPSLPVTPAPIRRPKFWGGGGPGVDEGDDDPSLPAAEGVPAQTEWNPAEQLQKLAKQQSDALLEKLGGSDHHDSSDLPPRPLPFGSEER
ncbi:nucleotide-diphospho-sugar transferase [Xylariomycetidae sp. FL0641]|nr:nucleotide-diphospho-sugar transferase [Xylariomycetidae sp. FL0641]